MRGVLRNALSLLNRAAQGLLVHIKIRNKFLLIFSLFALAPLLLTSLANQTVVEPLLVRNTAELQLKSLAQYRADIDHRIEFYDTISRMILQDRSLNERLIRQYEGILDVALTYVSFFDRYPNSYLKLNRYLTNVRIYVDNKTLNSDGSIIRPLTALPGQLDALRASETSRLLAMVEGPDSLRVYRLMNYFPKKLDAYPVLEFTFSAGELRDIVSASRSPFQTLCLFDQEGTPLLLSGDSGAVEQMEPLLGQMTDRRGIIGRLSMEEGLLLYETTSLGWKLVQQTQPGAAFADALHARNRLNCALLVSTVLLTAMILLISNRLSLRLSRLTQKIRAVQGGDYAPSTPAEGADEIGQASRAMDELAAELKHLIQTVYQSELNNTRLELDLAYARINPHFLYNTLSAIDWYVQKNDQRTSSGLIHDLAVFYRKSLNLGSEVVTLRDELIHLEAYLNIESRLSENIRPRIEVPEALYRVPINALTLQPIVENAIQHGLSSREGALAIEVRGAEHEGMLVLTVSDDGVGIPRESARAFNQTRQMPSRPHGIGLSNVDLRIRLRFGEEYGVTIVEKGGPGARVQVRLPL